MFRRKLSFFGHKMRRSCLEKDIILGMVEGKKRRGRPARVWMDDITIYSYWAAQRQQLFRRHRIVQDGGISIVSTTYTCPSGDYVTEWMK